MADNAAAYARLVSALRATYGDETAMSLTVGGSFEVMGAIEREILMSAGLREGQYLIDVGCGSGRLANALSRDQIRYLGIDIVPELLEYAQHICRRTDWRFKRVNSIAIPEADRSADMVCFFSVWTHLLHEDCYSYLLEARRVLKAGGRVVASFLEFRVPEHWAAFADAVNGVAPVHTQFCDRNAICEWAGHAGFRVEGFHDFAQGGPALGQSWCALEKVAH